MKLQDIITHRDNQKDESNLNINDNNPINKEETNDKNNSSNYSNTGSNMIEKEIDNNIKKKEKEKNKVNKINKDKVNDLIEKIKGKENININSPFNKPKLNINKLKEELKSGLEQLNDIKTSSNRPSLIGIKNDYCIEKNKNYNEIISELNKNIKQSKLKNDEYKKGSYLVYKNIQIIKPSYFFYDKKNKKDEKKYEYHKKNKNKFYLSSIDGKAIINGERISLNNNFDIFTKLNHKRNISTDRANTKIGRNNYNQEIGIRKVGYYNRRYFENELNRMSSLLFS